MVDPNSSSEVDNVLGLDASVSRPMMVFCVLCAFAWFSLAFLWNRHLQYAFFLFRCWPWTTKRQHYAVASPQRPNANDLDNADHNSSRRQLVGNSSDRQLVANGSSRTIVSNESTRSLVTAVTNESSRHVVTPSESFLLTASPNNNGSTFDLNHLEVDGYVHDQHGHRHHYRHHHHHHHHHHHRHQARHDHSPTRDADSPTRRRGVAPVLRLHHSLALLFSVQPFQKIFIVVTLTPPKGRETLLNIAAITGYGFELLTVVGSSMLLLKIAFGHEITCDGRVMQISHFAFLVFATIWSFVVVYCQQAVDKIAGGLGIIYIALWTVFLISVLGSAVYHTKYLFTQMFNLSELGVNPLTTPSFTKWWVLMRAWLLITGYALVMLGSVVVIRRDFTRDQARLWQSRYVVVHEIATYAIWICLALLFRCRNFHHSFTLLASGANGQPSSPVADLILRSTHMNQQQQNGGVHDANGDGGSSVHGAGNSPRRGLLKRLRLRRNPSKLKRKTSRIAVVVVNPQDQPALGTSTIGSVPSKNRSTTSKFISKQ